MLIKFDQTPEPFNKHNFQGWDRFSCIAVYAGSERALVFIKNILIYVLKLNKGLTGLERHEGE